MQILSKSTETTRYGTEVRLSVPQFKSAQSLLSLTGYHHVGNLMRKNLSVQSMYALTKKSGKLFELHVINW